MFKGFFLALLVLFAGSAYGAVGDTVNGGGLVSVSSGAFLDVRPGVGVEWSVFNIHHEHDIEVSWYDGTNEIATARFIGAGKQSMNVRVTNSVRLRIKNLHGSASKLIGFDGVQTK